MPAPDYPRVPFPDTPAPARLVRADGWWYEPPIERHIFDAIDSTDSRIARVSAEIDRWPAPKVAEALDKGWIDGWPWTLTAKGKSVLGSARRR